jgi:hypothetical protein
MITEQMVADKIAAWPRHENSQAERGAWAEEAVAEGEFPDAHAPELTRAVSRSGLADVKECGLVWDDCEDLLKSLGLTARIDITAA